MEENRIDEIMDSLSKIEMRLDADCTQLYFNRILARLKNLENILNKPKKVTFIGKCKKVCTKISQALAKRKLKKKIEEQKFNFSERGKKEAYERMKKMQQRFIGKMI